MAQRREYTEELYKKDLHSPDNHDGVIIHLEPDILTNLDSILKNIDTTLPIKVRLVKAMVFPVVMYGCESWNVKKAEHRRIDAFELWCWRRLLSPLDCKEIQPAHSEEDQPWDFFGRNDAKAETLVLWAPHGKS